MHLPQFTFSHCQLNLFLWLCQINQIDDVLTVKGMQHANIALQKICSIDMLAYDGVFGQRYHVNSLAQIIMQDLCQRNLREPPLPCLV